MSRRRTDRMLPLAPYLLKVTTQQKLQVFGFDLPVFIFLIKVCMAGKRTYVGHVLSCVNLV